jgi:hypothetical protein
MPVGQDARQRLPAGPVENEDDDEDDCADRKNSLPT